MFYLLVVGAMVKSADVIIIGAGIFGCALFHELSKQGFGKILLLEKNRIASATTAQSGGLIRKFLQSPQLHKFTDTSYDYYVNFSENVGSECGFRQVGCCYWMPEIDTHIKQQLKFMKQHHYPIEILKDNYADIFPDYKNEFNDCLVYEPQAACIDTRLASLSWIKSGIKNNSAIVQEDTAVNELLIQQDRVCGVKTSQGITTADKIILCSGAWSVNLLKQHNILLNIKSKAFQYYRYQQSEIGKSPAIIDMRNKFYSVPAPNNIMISGLFNHDIPINTDDKLPAIDEYQTDFHQNVLALRYPLSNKLTRLSTHTAIDCYNDNDELLFGKIPQIDGLYLASVGNDGGIKIAPGVAKYIANLLM